MATQTEPGDFKAISLLADGINHAVPTSNEMQRSVSWLIRKDLVEKKGAKYLLTTKGREEFDNASENSTKLLEIWKILEKRFIEYK